MILAMSHNCLFLFHTPLGIIQLKKKLNAEAISFSVIDAPRALSSECGMGVKFSLSHERGYQPFMNEQVKAVYRIENERYHLIWEDES